MKRMSLGWKAKFCSSTQTATIATGWILAAKTAAAAAAVVAAAWSQR